MSTGRTGARGGSWRREAGSEYGGSWTDVCSNFDVESVSDWDETISVVSSSYASTIGPSSTAAYGDFVLVGDTAATEGATPLSAVPHTYLSRLGPYSRRHVIGGPEEDEDARSVTTLASINTRRGWPCVHGNAGRATTPPAAAASYRDALLSRPAADARASAPDSAAVAQRARDVAVNVPVPVRRRDGAPSFAVDRSGRRVVVIPRGRSGLPLPRLRARMSAGGGRHGWARRGAQHGVDGLGGSSASGLAPVSEYDDELDCYGCGADLGVELEGGGGCCSDGDDLQ